MSVILRDEAKALTVPTASVSVLTFSSGDEVTLGAADKVMLVGANNSGKSRTIREIVRTCTEGERGGHDRVVLRAVKLRKMGTQDEFESYVKRSSKLVGQNYVIGDWPMPMYNLNSWGADYLTGGVAAGFIRNIDANNRLSITDVQASISPDEVPSRPQHLMYRNETLMEQVSDLFKRAFSQELMINFLGGSKIPIHVGAKPRGVGFEDRVSDKYSTAVMSQPALHEQGDGMKSYAGILFDAVASKRDITLIDEPEAFLHPPQMRRLGETLSEHVAGQLIVATHSSDILRGFLEGQKGGLRILRIRRDGDVNRIYEAKPADIKALWITPVLRFSNALEAIFHDQAILCEDDSDCRLLSSVADHLQSSSKEAWRDTAYIPMGGKAGIPKAAAVLRAVGVPVKAVFDFDLISERRRLRETVEAFGGDWSAIGTLWARVAAAVQKVKVPTASEIKDEVREILAQSGESEIPRSEVDEAFRRRSPWAAVKRHGLNGVPSGHVNRECEQMVGLLADLGIYLVPGGEMESFCRSIGGHGPKFVTEVLTTVPLEDARLDALREFTTKVHKGASASIESVGTIEEQLAREASKSCNASEEPDDLEALQS